MSHTGTDRNEVASLQMGRAVLVPHSQGPVQVVTLLFCTARVPSLATVNRDGFTLKNGAHLASEFDKNDLNVQCEEDGNVF